MRRHELTAIIQPLLPTKVRGVPRVDDRRVINGILWRFRTGAPWRDVPGPWPSDGMPPESGIAFTPYQRLTTGTS